MEITRLFLPHGADRAGLGSAVWAPGLTIGAASPNPRGDRSSPERAPTLPCDRRSSAGPAGRPQALRGDFEVQESGSRDEALELIRDVGSFDVAIVDMRRDLRRWRRRSTANETIRAMRRTEPGARHRRPRRAPRAPPGHGALQAGASAYVARTAERRGCCSGGRRRRSPRSASSTRRCRRGQPRQADPPPARDPAAARQRRLDHGRRPRARPQRGDGQDPHEERPRPPRRPQPHPRGRDRPPRVPDRVAADGRRGPRSSRGRGR